MIADLHIRPMALADIVRVVGLAATLPDAPQWQPETYRAALQPGAQPERIALIAEMSGSVAGFIMAWVIAPEAELESIAVATGWQRCGVARALLAALDAELLSRAVTALLLEVRASNAVARAFYKAEGFHEAGLRPHYYSYPTEDDAILMRRNFF